MSQALASARKRRAPPEPVPTIRPQQQQQQQGVNAPGLTLPQVIALVDKRLIALETHAKEQLEKQQQPEVQLQNAPVPSNIAEVLDEYSSRFDIIAEELASLKNMLLTLQSFTMEVNKTLMDDRIRILSDAPTPLERALAEN
jgi:hypothetical protein